MPTHTNRCSKIWPYLFLLPALVVFALFCYYPLGDTIYRSLYSTDLFGRPVRFVGFTNYIEMFTSAEFLRVIGVTVAFVVGCVLLKLIIGLAVAVPLSTRLAGTAFARPIVLIPMAFSSAVAAVVFKMMYQPATGTFDQILNAVGAPTPAWLTSPRWSLASIVFADTWVGLGLVILLLMAALDSVPDSTLEAAALDGATGWRRMWSIQIPLITPTLFFVIVTQTVQALREFTLIRILTEGGPSGSSTTLTYELYRIAFASNADYGSSAAHGVVLMIVVAAVTYLQFHIGERRVNY